ncbi:MAG: lipopolysaccharide biosynthesis [Pseudomonadota bacterium]
MSSTAFYLRLLMRRAPIMLTLFLICAVIGLAVATRMPTIFASSARLLLQTQEVSRDLAASTVQIEALEELRLLREQMLRRSVLIDVAHEYAVFEDIRSMAPDAILEGMQGALRMETSGGPSRTAGPQPALMTIRFEARTGQIAADVVNEFVTRIRSANVEIRTDQANQTLSFFRQEIERLSGELATRSGAIAAFQSENADALPDDQPFRLQRQAVLQQLLASSERELRALEETRARTIQVFEATGNIGGTPQSPEEQELDAMQTELRRLSVTLSDTNPRIVQLRRQIEQLEAEIAVQIAVPEADGETFESDDPTAPLLALQLGDIDSRIEALQGEMQDARIELALLENAIARAPGVSIEMANLQRQYDQVQEEYNRMQNSLAQASIGERVEREAGQRVELLDPATVPNQPVGTSRIIIVAGAAAFGLMLAAAYFVLLELLNRTVRRPSELVRALDITPLATIPYIETLHQRFWRRAGRALALLLVLAGIPVALWIVDQNVIPIEELATFVMSRSGLF